VEIKLAKQLFRQDYQNNIVPKIATERKELDVEIQNKQKELDEACSPDVFNQTMRATIGRVVMIVDGNFEAAKDEKGEIAKLVRGIIGISITDIFKYGLAGGENSEINKLRATWSDALDNAGIGENHFVREALRGIDPTNIDMPNQVKITVDSKSVPNLVKNLTGGLVKW